jgi:phosphoadenosine phosphosulfate reductase
MRRKKANHGDLSSRREEEEEKEEQGSQVGRLNEAWRRAQQGSKEEPRQGVQEQVRQVRQGLTPLADAERLIADVHRRTDRILVGLSGGKDSLVTLDMCVREFGAENVRAFFMYLVKGLRCVETTIRWCERRYKIDVTFLPHWQLGNSYKYAEFMPHRTGASEWRDMRLIDVEKAARLKTEAEWLAYGHRMTDSIERVGMLSKNQGLDHIGRRVYPLWRWNEASVMAYLRHHKIPPPPRLSVLKRSMSGVSFQEDTLLAIREKFPDDYEKILEVFPYVGAKLARYEMKKKNWKQDTYVDRWKTSLKDR